MKSIIARTRHARITNRPRRPRKKYSPRTWPYKVCWFRPTWNLTTTSLKVRRFRTGALALVFLERLRMTRRDLPPAAITVKKYVAAVRRWVDVQEGGER